MLLMEVLLLESCSMFLEERSVGIISTMTGVVMRPNERYAGVVFAGVPMLNVTDFSEAYGQGTTKMLLVASNVFLSHMRKPPVQMKIDPIFRDKIDIGGVVTWDGGALRSLVSRDFSVQFAMGSRADTQDITVTQFVGEGEETSRMIQIKRNEEFAIEGSGSIVKWTAGVTSVNSLTGMFTFLTK